jgi:hypothetical protein
MTPADIEEMKRLSGKIEEGIKAIIAESHKLAEAERDYRKARGIAWVKVEHGTAAFREAQVDSQTADLRFARDLADGMRRAAIEAVRSRQQQLSAWQSIVRAQRAEVELAGFGPEEGP